MSKFRKYGLYASLGLATMAFAAAGIAKLAGVEQMHMSFAAMGLPVWFGYFIGASELAGAIGIWLKKLSISAASGLLIIMAGALYFHLVYDAVANAVPAIVLSLLLINIIHNRRKGVITQ
ncbi:DoxX family protein [Paraglaciecola polaris]|uniref:DoxX family protein n=1 Tax=Paraglaciecola polaris LMG 21857 TaxID=1129793 RepID=K6YPR2_9ALTE|nr:DoxX family protein [Paraglaciecola polaris]GAC34724.1 DoxX family protein [Paraglaciecola polaris LMG 21857]